MCVMQKIVYNKRTVELFNSNADNASKNILKGCVFSSSEVKHLHLNISVLSMVFENCFYCFLSSLD